MIHSFIHSFHSFHSFHSYSFTGLPGGNNDAPPPTEKPSYVEVQAGKWGAPWKLALSKDELERLPHELHAATLSIRGRIGRRNVAYPMPVGAHSVTESKKL